MTERNSREGNSNPGAGEFAKGVFLVAGPLIVGEISKDRLSITGGAPSLPPWLDLSFHLRRTSKVVVKSI
jgi:hypothetical protein